MTHLPDRAVLRLTGEDARSWFANIVTCDIAGLMPGEARWGALLAPQGKILFDFLATPDGGDGLLLDTDRDKAADFSRRLNFYRLRARVTIEDLSADEGFAVHAFPPAQDGGAIAAYVDPRDPDLGRRGIAPRPGQPDDEAFAAYHARRIALGIPEGGKDFAWGEAFPHEVLMDMLGGVDFRKGCYVGQEVVSRMQHRGTARTRIVPVSASDVLPPAGTEVRIADKVAGTLGSSSGRRGLAMLRLDRVQDGLDAGAVPTAGHVALALVRPRWWMASWPAPAQADAIP
ncbi:CAF17-like 4Fe-4S cluster assembly/insertion protein YgfZ [Labrys monachus]|uniref:Folate-binding protein YgfZ n=1 Tax=Labrys monachus TaxID=217067 RepID=A0ABU0FC56_9HYPH|nr:folate-binding protein [Labrys monachus]MDQ0391683.1 folate-binding protein YgfZ [Labrys monachus]